MFPFEAINWEKKEKKTEKKMYNVNSIFPCPLLIVESKKVIGMGPLFSYWGFPRTVNRRDAAKSVPATQGSEINTDYYCQGFPSLIRCWGHGSVSPSHAHNPHGSKRQRTVALPTHGHGDKVPLGDSSTETGQPEGKTQR